MKKLMMIFALALFVMIGFTKCTKEHSIVVPEPVKKAFATAFPKAVDAEWSIEKADTFEVEFKIEKAGMSALFDKEGALLETESIVVLNALPDTAKATLSKDFAGYKLAEIEKTDAKGVVTYEMKAEKGETELELVFDQGGKLLNKVVAKEEKEEKKDGKKENKEEDKD